MCCSNLRLRHPPPEAPPAPEPEPAVAVPKDALIPSYSDKIPHWEDHTLQQREDVARVAEQKAVIPVLTYSMIELVKSACLAAADAESAASCWFSFALSDPVRAHFSMAWTTCGARSASHAPRQTGRFAPR